MTASEHMERVAGLGCCVCRRLNWGYVPAQAHHVAEGSGLRSDWAVVPLCPEHHTGASGFHKRGKAFLSQFRVPGESEYGLLVWTIEDLARVNRSGCVLCEINKNGERVMRERAQKAETELARERAARHPMALALSSVLRACPSPTDGAGIYAFFVNNEVVYIGQSNNVKTRVNGRANLVDRVTMIQVDNPGERRTLECDLIRALNPKGNVQHKQSDMERG